MRLAHVREHNAPAGAFWRLVLAAFAFAALFIVAGKRHAEVMTLGLGAANHRESLREYPEGFVQWFEALKGDREGRYSIRVNDQWRICFVWKSGNAHEVEIVDYY